MSTEMTFPELLAALDTAKASAANRLEMAARQLRHAADIAELMARCVREAATSEDAAEDFHVGHEAVKAALDQMTMDMLERSGFTLDELAR